MFDGSSITGWKNIAHSDMILMPDLQNPFHLDPFCEKPTLLLRCDVIEPATMKGYERDPRFVAKRAEAYLKETGIADVCYFGPEPEFFIFDNVRWGTNMNGTFYAVDSQEGTWNSITEYTNGNLGHRPSVKGGYFPVPPVDSSQDIRSTMCKILEDMGIPVECHHHEVGNANQNEIGTVFNSLRIKADQLMMFKYIVHNVAHNFGKSATFMPKPLVGENGNGMHCHQSLAKDGQNLFAGEKYAGLSELGLYYIGGIIKHAKALNAFTNPATNSYKRLVPGFEAPVMLTYSSKNRSAAIRIPFVSTPKARRIEVRFPDPLANPYLAFSAMMMAGLDGILNKINPGDPMDKDLYDLPPKEANNIPTVCHLLDQAIDALQRDHDFLLKGNVFSIDMLEGYIEIKKREIARLRMATHPIEFDMYYSL
jgi:glutamine synthetase